MRWFMVLSVAGAAAWLLVRPAPGVDASQEAPVVYMDPAVAWTPESPREGRLFRIRVTASEHSPLMGVHGRAGGEELHFERLGDRVFESLAPVPVDAESPLQATFRVVYAAGGEKHLTASIPLLPGDYPLERLTVAPRFGTPPDSADRAHLQRDREKAAAAAALAHRTGRIWDETVVMPRESLVTGGFGDGRIFNGQVSSRHMGLDLRGARGDTVVAAARGVVVVVDPFLLAGNVVYLNHGAGLLSAYFHLSRQLVEVGDTVEAGEPVGLVGATGRVTGPHLHWVVRYGTTSVDPRSLLEVAGVQVPGGS
jgi:murein DD-endopeptidase MepM/ murein hydrolase activator NlpD